MGVVIHVCVTYFRAGPQLISLMPTFRSLINLIIHYEKNFYLLVLFSNFILFQRRKNSLDFVAEYIDTV